MSTVVRFFKRCANGSELVCISFDSDSMLRIADPVVLSVNTPLLTSCGEAILSVPVFPEPGPYVVPNLTFEADGRLGNVSLEYNVLSDPPNVKNLACVVCVLSRNRF